MLDAYYDIPDEAFLFGCCRVEIKKWPLVLQHLHPKMLCCDSAREVWRIFDEGFNTRAFSEDWFEHKLIKLAMAKDDHRMFVGDVLGAPGTLKLEALIDSIKEAYFEREAKRLSADLKRAAASANEEAIERALQEKERLRSEISASPDKVENLTSLFDIAMADIERMLESNNIISTGYSLLDSKFDGFAPGCLYILAARPSFGKTACALNFASNIVRAGKDVAFFSLEMTPGQIGQRLLATASNVSSAKMRRGDLDDDDFDRIVAGVRNWAEFKGGFFLEAGVFSLKEIAARVTSINVQKNVDVVFIDYLTIIKTERAQNREREVAELSTNLKRLALELNIPIVCLAQPSRDIEKTDRLPRNADLRDSGQIEQDADVIFWVHRERSDIDQSSFKDTMSFLVTKNRHGETGLVNGFKFNGATQTLVQI